MKQLKRNIKTMYSSLFKSEKRIDRLHNQFVLVPADKAGNNDVFICKVHYIKCILTWI